MSELLIALLIALIVAEFWRSRQQTELAQRLTEHYCRRQEWQWITLARHDSELMPLLLRELLRRPSCFVFEFSTNGEDQGSGELILTGLAQPLFRIITPQPNRHEAAISSGLADHVPSQGQADNNVLPFRPKQH